MMTEIKLPNQLAYYLHDDLIKDKNDQIMAVITTYKDQDDNLFYELSNQELNKTFETRHEAFLYWLYSQSLEVA